MSCVLWSEWGRQFVSCWKQCHKITRRYADVVRLKQGRKKASTTNSFQSAALHEGFRIHSGGCLSQQSCCSTCRIMRKIAFDEHFFPINFGYPTVWILGVGVRDNSERGSNGRSSSSNSDSSSDSKLCMCLCDEIQINQNAKYYYVYFNRIHIKQSFRWQFRSTHTHKHTTSSRVSSFIFNCTMLHYCYYYYRCRQLCHYHIAVDGCCCCCCCCLVHMKFSVCLQTTSLFWNYS